MQKIRKAGWQKRLGMVCALLAISACQTTSQMEPVQSTSYTSRHPIVVVNDVVSLKVHGQGSKGHHGLSNVQRNKVQAFISSYKDTGTGSLKIKAPSSVVHDVLAASTVAEVRRIVERNRVPRSRVRMANYYPRNPRVSSPVIISFHRHGAIANKCGAWPESNTITYKNEPSWSFGCATQNNLAAMIANPQDLVEPRAVAPADAQRRDNVFAKYREGAVTTASRSDAEKGSISNVAQ